MSFTLKVDWNRSFLRLSSFWLLNSILLNVWLLATTFHPSLSPATVAWPSRSSELQWRVPLHCAGHPGSRPRCKALRWPLRGFHPAHHARSQRGQSEVLAPLSSQSSAPPWFSPSPLVLTSPAGGGSQTGPGLKPTGFSIEDRHVITVTVYIQ